MHLRVIPTPFFAANCVILVPDGGDQALVVDPSHGVLDQIEAVLAELGVTVAAVLCTHGHPDHVWDAAAVAKLGADPSAQVPVWIPGPDAYRLVDPLAHVPMRPQAMDLTWQAPEDVEECPVDSFEYAPGVWLRMVPAPGHSEGSALFLGHSDLLVRTGDQTIYRADTPIPWALSADVIFAGSVGRTDLPGGDETQMRHTLRTLANVIDPDTILCPGHGPLTSMRAELATNPYLRRATHSG